MPNLVPTICSIDNRSLIEFRINPGQCCQIDNGTPSNALPDAGNDINRLEQLRFQQHRAPLSAKQDNQIIDNPIPCRKVVNHTTYDDQRYEMRHIGNCLYGSLEPFLPQLIQKERQDNGSRKGKDQTEYINQQCIFQQPPKVIAVKELLKPLKPHPWTSQNSLCRRKVLKCDCKPIHRAILKNNVICQNRQSHQIDQPVFSEIPGEHRPIAAFFRNAVSCILHFLSFHRHKDTSFSDSQNMLICFQSILLKGCRYHPFSNTCPVRYRFLPPYLALYRSNASCCIFRASSIFIFFICLTNESNLSRDSSPMINLVVISST